jgi:hypothetical protein
MVARTTGACALAGMVLTFAPIIAISTRGEPSFDATAAEAATFFRNGDVAWVHLVGALAPIGMIVLLWFVVGLTTLLREVEKEPAWRSTVALMSGSLLAAYGVIDASWSAASNRGDDLDPAIALYAFDVGNLGFANSWAALGSFGIAVGWVLLDSKTLPSWWAWWIVIAGAGLIVARLAWQQPVWFWPYALLWAWIATIGVRLVRGMQFEQPRFQPAGPRRAADRDPTWQPGSPAPDGPPGDQDSRAENIAESLGNGTGQACSSRRTRSGSRAAFASLGSGLRPKVSLTDTGMSRPLSVRPEARIQLRRRSERMVGTMGRRWKGPPWRRPGRRRVRRAAVRAWGGPSWSGRGSWRATAPHARRLTDRRRAPPFLGPLPTSPPAVSARRRRAGRDARGGPGLLVMVRIPAIHCRSAAAARLRGT